MVMPVRVGAYKGLVSGEMLFTELLAQLLRPVYGQAVVCPVPVSYTHLTRYISIMRPYTTSMIQIDNAFMVSPTKSN